MKKFMISFTAVCLVAVVALTATLSLVADTFKYGDVNKDTKINNRDLGLLQQYLNEKNPAGFNKELADVQYDKKINNRDLGLLQQYINEYPVHLGPDEPVIPDDPFEPEDPDDNRFNDTELEWN